MIRQVFARSAACLSNLARKENFLAFRKFSTDRKIQDIFPKCEKTTIGNYLARSLANAGATHFFTVPGDYILSLLDEFLKVPNFKMINCCNELNASYAADGNVRSTDTLGVVVVTYMVGGLSAINAVAGAYSDDLPLICISGGPNIYDAFDRRLLHHTIGERDIYQQSECYKPVVGKSFVIRHQNEAREMIDDAIKYTLMHKKPVYLEIPTNLCLSEVSAPIMRCTSGDNGKRFCSDPVALSQALNAILYGINAALRPVIICGPKLKQTNAIKPFQKLAEMMGCGIATMPDAKGIISEQHPQYMGHYWGPISSPHVAEIVESSDLIILGGVVLNDYTTAGWTSLLPQKKILAFQSESTSFGEAFYPNVHLPDILDSLLCADVPHRTASYQTYLRHKDLSGVQRCSDCNKADNLSLKFLRDTIQKLLTSSTTLITETGDSWFIGQTFKLPEGCRYHVQMQYGSIGWSVGATLGIALAEGHNRRVLALIGDGSFQMSAQEVSTMIRHKVKATIILLNNDGYTIEVQIHDGPYNDIKRWDYTAFVKAIANEQANEVLIVKVKTNQEFEDAIHLSERHDGLSFIECMLDRDDCTDELLEWGSRVAKSNSRQEI